MEQITYILPTGKILQQNSTHVAIKEAHGITIWTKGFVIPAEGDDEEMRCEPEKINTLALDEEDDLFDIFEKLDEDNRINLAEINGTIWD